MAKELYNGIYSSHKIVFIERVERNLGYYLKNKLEVIKKLGQEVFCIVRKDNLYEVLKELKYNPELEVQILNGLSLFNSAGRDFLILNLSSASNNFSIVLKVILSSFTDAELEREYNELISVIKKVFDSAQFYEIRTGLREDQVDISVKNQILNGLDGLDMYITAEHYKIGEVYIDTKVSKVTGDGFFKNAKLSTILTCISRFDYNAGIFPELCFCLAVEELMQLKVPKRVQYIRMIMCELFRISSHLHFISNICKVLGCEIVYNQCLFERERVLRIIEFITGSRIHPNFIRIGGVRKDLNYDKIKNIRENLPVIFKRVNRLESLILDNSIITAKLKDIGVVDKNTALELGVTGPNLRASGIKYDIRKNRNLLLYKDMSFLIVAGKYGDCLDRVQLRFREIFQSLKIIHQIINELPEEHIKKLINLDELYFPYSVMFSQVECPHGVFRIYFEIKDNMILNMLIMGPSKNSLNLIEKTLSGHEIEELEIILASFDISSGEIIEAKR
ncbi:MAG: NADH-quinone oxidoreductase subunit D [Actinobacteria bacterium]|nr:NADH-quinone oxidoreductase subunit D [Actinomycetota bacterium]